MAAPLWFPFSLSLPLVCRTCKTSCPLLIIFTTALLGWKPIQAVPDDFRQQKSQVDLLSPGLESPVQTLPLTSTRTQSKPKTSHGSRPRPKEKLSNILTPAYVLTPN